MKNFLKLGVVILIAGFFLGIIFLLADKKIIEQTTRDINNVSAQNIPLDNIPNKITSVEVEGTNINVDLAETAADRAQGLSGRKIIKEDEGMFFIFDYPDKYSFWMKDMNFPIDIIWIGEEKKIVYIKKNALPDSYPAEYTPSDNAKYVLEVVSGFSDKYKLKIGDSVVFR